MFKETALLERIHESHEIFDSEGKRTLNQAVTSMDIVQPNTREIKAMDTEVLNHRLHVISLLTSMADPMPN